MARALTYRREAYSGLSIVRWLVGLVFGVILTLVAARFIFELFGANQYSSLVSWVYATSDPLVRPFSGIFGTPRVQGVSFVDMAAIVAFLIYGILMYFIQYALGGFRRNEVEGERYTEEVHDHHDDTY